jgi:hypothetical protein
MGVLSSHRETGLEIKEAFRDHRFAPSVIHERVAKSFQHCFDEGAVSLPGATKKAGSLFLDMVAEVELSVLRIEEAGPSFPFLFRRLRRVFSAASARIDHATSSVNARRSAQLPTRRRESAAEAPRCVGFESTIGGAADTGFTPPSRSLY